MLFVLHPFKKWKYLKPYRVRRRSQGEFRMIFVCLFFTKSYNIAQAVLELSIFLPQFPA